MEFVIVTGMSGAGKSQAANVLEDIGYFCVDNVPPMLIPSFLELMNHDIDRVAIVTDIRGGKLFDDIMRVMDELDKRGIHPFLLFLDASDDVLCRRYKETRRTHPFCENGNLTLQDAVKKEREMLESIRQRADQIVDTSATNVSQLKSRIYSIFLGSEDKAMSVRCVSFGFKYGIVSDADLVFDVRCLPNPFYVDELKNKTGLDKPVRDYVMSGDSSDMFTSKIFELIDCSIPLYIKEGKTQLVVAVGCTGGKHRSVTVAEMLYHHLLDKGQRASVMHRDISKL